MADKEKVLKGLENCAIKQSCLGCPYCKGNATCQDDMAKDALELLKERLEPVEPHMVIAGSEAEWQTWWYKCGACSGQVNPGDKYCWHCGRALKWE